MWSCVEGAEGRICRMIFDKSVGLWWKLTESFWYWQTEKETAGCISSVYQIWIERLWIEAGRIQSTAYEGSVAGTDKTNSPVRRFTHDRFKSNFFSIAGCSRRQENTFTKIATYGCLDCLVFDQWNWYGWRIPIFQG